MRNRFLLALPASITLLIGLVIGGAIIVGSAIALAHGGEVHRATGLPTIGVAVSFEQVSKKGAPVHGALTLTVPKGWHVYATGAPEEFVPVSMAPQPGVVEGWRVAWPAPGHVTFEGIKMPVYEGRVIVPLTGTLATDPPAEWKGTVTFQACGAELCLPPETREVAYLFGSKADGS